MGQVPDHLAGVDASRACKLANLFDSLSVCLFELLPDCGGRCRVVLVDLSLDTLRMHQLMGFLDSFLLELLVVYFNRLADLLNIVHFSLQLCFKR